MLQPLLDNLYDVLPSPVVGVLVVVGAAACGAAIGWDRERLQKPAGLVTMALIAVGAAIYTQSSLLLGVESGDPARVAAQIVTGIGFLGAGAIIRDKGAITGLTTAATIWSVAAVGIVLGGGYLAGGIMLTVLILAILTGLKRVEKRIMGPCKIEPIQLDFQSDGGKTRMAILALLDDYHMNPDTCRFTPLGEATDPPMERLTLNYCRIHKHHRRMVSELAAMAAVQQVVTGTPHPLADSPNAVQTQPVLD